MTGKADVYFHDPFPLGPNKGVVWIKLPAKLNPENSLKDWDVFTSASIFLESFILAVTHRA